MTREEFVGALRRVADIFEHNDVPVPQYQTISCFAAHTPEQAKADVAAFVHGAAGIVDKQDDDDYIKLSLRGLPDDFSFCLLVQKRVLGCRKVQVERMVVEEKWECGPILDSLPESEEVKA